MYALLSIFIIIPLIYSHTFARLGEFFVIENGIGNFESVKISLFFFLLILATIEMMISEKSIRSKRTGILLAGLSVFLVGEIMLFGGETLYGIGEKQHGSLFFAGLIWFGYLLSYVKKYSPLWIISVVSTATLVATIAIIEYLFSYNLFTGFLDELRRSWGSGRAVSTLGNPNYVAGYLLMILPLVFHHAFGWKKYTLLAIFFLGIFSTGSFIGISLSCSYGIYMLLRKYWKKEAEKLFFISILLALSMLYLFIHGTEKELSLLSRFVLMKEVLLQSLSHVDTFFLGNGPNGIIQYFEAPRSQEVMAYFPNEMIIDSSHNIFIDIMYKFGMLGGILCAYYSLKVWGLLSKEQKMGLILGFIFFGLNVSIISTYILMVFYSVQKESDA